MLGQRQLHQNAVHRRVGRQRLYLRQQLALRNIGRQFDMHRLETDGLGGLALAADIDFRSRVVTHQHGGQPRLQAVPGC